MLPHLIVTFISDKFVIPPPHKRIPIHAIQKSQDTINVTVVRCINQTLFQQATVNITILRVYMTKTTSIIAVCEGTLDLIL